MMVFGSHEPSDHELSDEHLATALTRIKRDARDRRIALMAPMVLAAAVVAAFVAAPPQHGGLQLVPEADASDEIQLPRVFGENGVWRLAEPIGEAVPSVPGPPWMIDFPDEPDTPEFVLVAPDELPVDESSTDPSLPASASTPPTPTLGQSDASTDPAELDWSQFQPAIRVEAPAEPLESVAPAEQVAPTESAEQAEPAVDDTLSPDASASAEDVAPPTSSSPDEDVPVAVDPPTEPTGDGVDFPDVADLAVPGTETPADTGDLSDANPSTPQPDQADQGTQLPDAVATIVPQSVLVHRAHVSVTVQVVDDDSSVIDWCNTRVDWGDGSVTGLSDPGGDASCTASCEREASPSAAELLEPLEAFPTDARAGSINETLTFVHDYAIVIDAAPRVFVATGDGCSYRLAELQLNQFTVVPY